MYLRTLGHPALLDADGTAVHTLRKKDLALLVYLCVEGSVVHSRGRLAALLWGESPEEAARHSLTQALGRLGRTLPPGSMRVENQVVHWCGALPCDAVALLRGGLGPADVDDGFSLYEGEFLRGFHPRAGAEEFMEWADWRRADLRNAALRLLEVAGDDAAARREWRRAARLAERAVQIEPVAEDAHRRLMRVLAAWGERNRALRHYHDLAEWLARELGAEPDPDTRALAEQLRAEAADPPPPVRWDPEPVPLPGAAPLPPAGPLPSTPTENAADPPPDPSAPPEDAAAASRDGPTADEGTPAAEAPASPAPPPPSRDTRNVWIALVAVIALALGLRVWPAPAPPPEQVGHGETLRQRGGSQVYLAYGETLYAYPDEATLHACTGVHTPPVREVARLPPWPRRRLPSVHAHPWLGGTMPVIADGRRDQTAYVAVGCILVGVPDPPTLDSIFGRAALRRLFAVPGEVLPSIPRDVIAYGHPVRPAGTLIRSPGGVIRWITYHGGALAVPDSAVLSTHCRSPREAVPVSEAEFRYYHPFAQLHPATVRCPLNGGADRPCPCRAAPESARGALRLQPRVYPPGRVRGESSDSPRWSG